MAENDRAAEETAESMARKYLWWLTNLASTDGMTQDAVEWAVAEIDRLRAERAELLAALKSASFVLGDGFLWGECDECCSADSDGHTSTCKLGTTIRDILALLSKVSP